MSAEEKKPAYIVFITTHGHKKYNKINKEMESFMNGNTQHMYIHTTLPGKVICLEPRNNYFILDDIKYAILANNITYSNEGKNKLLDILKDKLLNQKFDIFSNHKPNPDDDGVEMQKFFHSKPHNIYPDIIEADKRFEEKYYTVNFDELVSNSSLIDGIHVFKPNQFEPEKIFPATWKDDSQKKDPVYHAENSIMQFTTHDDDHAVSLSQLIEILKQLYPGENFIFIDFSCDDYEGDKIPESLKRYHQLTVKRRPHSPEITPTQRKQPRSCEDDNKRSCAVMGRTSRKKRKKRKKRKQTNNKRNSRGDKKKKKSKNKKRRNKTN